MEHLSDYEENAEITEHFEETYSITNEIRQWKQRKNPSGFKRDSAVWPHTSGSTWKNFSLLPNTSRRYTGDRVSRSRSLGCRCALHLYDCLQIARWRRCTWNLKAAIVCLVRRKGLEVHSFYKWPISSASAACKVLKGPPSSSHVQDAQIHLQISTQYNTPATEYSIYRDEQM